MTWEEWQKSFWSTGDWERVYKNRTLDIEGAGRVTFYRAVKAQCQTIKDNLEKDGEEGLEIIAPHERGNDGSNYILIQNPNKIGPQIQYQNLLD